MSSLPSLLARGYLRSRHLPRLSAVPCRLQHAPSPSTTPRSPIAENVHPPHESVPPLRSSSLAGSRRHDGKEGGWIGTGNNGGGDIMTATSESFRVVEDAFRPLGIPRPLILALAEHFPHIDRPTSAQKALFGSTLRESKDVFLKDQTGRGKTFALALIALSRAFKIRTKRHKASTKSFRTPAPIRGNSSPSVLLILPHATLVGQVGRWMALLEASLLSNSSGNEGRLTEIVMPGDVQKGERKAVPEILVSTPDALLAYLQTPSTKDLAPNKRATTSSAIITPTSLTRSLQLVMADEIDAMLRPLPGRFKTFTSERERQRHPFYRHPPAIVRLLDEVLVSAGGGGDRRRVQTVWSSATLNSVVRGFIHRSGWIGKGEQVLIDTTSIADRPIHQTMQEDADESQVPSSQRTIHHCLVVDPITGGMHNLESSTADSSYTDYVEPDPSDPSVKEKIHPFMVESLALLYASRNMDKTRKGHSLVIVPDGTSMPKLQESLSNLGVSSTVVDGLDSREEDVLLLVTRSHVRGLDLPDIDTVYLPNGLDVGSMSKTSRSTGGMEERKREYTHFAGRMGRLGATKAEPTEYAVVNLVMRESADEKALKSMFVDKPYLRVRRLEAAGVDE